jgi:hypothetical protein
VTVSPDHWANFFLDNYPAVCIGVGETNEGPPEPWMKAYPHRNLAGHAAFAMHIAEEALRQGFEPSISHRLKLDHGTCIPLWRMELPKMPALVPMLVNSIEPPMPSLARCLEWGKLLRKAIESFPGISASASSHRRPPHSIGENDGLIHEDFDRETIKPFLRKVPRRYLSKELLARGNGPKKCATGSLPTAQQADAASNS